MATTPQPTFTPGQRVEVQVCDFKAAGMPYIWVAGTVRTVEPMGATAGGGTVWDVLVDTDEKVPCGPAFVRQLVGPRGGGRKVRAL